MMWHSKCLRRCMASSTPSSSGCIGPKSRQASGHQRSRRFAKWTETSTSKAQAPLRHPSASMVPGWCQSIQHQSPSTLALLPAQSMQTRTPGARWAALESAGSQEHLGLAPRLRPMWVQELRKIHLFGHPHCQWRQDCQTVVQKR